MSHASSKASSHSSSHSHSTSSSHRLAEPFQKTTTRTVTRWANPNLNLTPDPIYPSEIPRSPIYPTAIARSPIYSTAVARRPIYPAAIPERPIYPTESPIYPAESPIYPTESPIYPTETPIYPTAIHPAPIYPRIHSRYLSPSTLRYYNLPWEYDIYDANYIIIKREISRPETDILFEHQRSIRGGRQLLLLDAPREERKYAFYRKRHRSSSRIRRIGVVEL